MTRRTALPGLARDVAGAAASLPPVVATVVLAFALVHAGFTGRLPVLTAGAAFAGAASASAALRRGALRRGVRPDLVVGSTVAVACMLAAAALTGLEEVSRVAPRSGPTVLSASVACAAVGALLGGLRRAGGDADEPDVGLLCAAQRHPWLATGVVLCVAGADLLLDDPRSALRSVPLGGWRIFLEGFTRMIRAPSAPHVLVVVGALVCSIHLVARSRDGSGRTAPLVLGVPVGTAGAALAVGVAYRGGTLRDAAAFVLRREDVLLAALGLCAWCAVIAHLFAHAPGRGGRVRLATASLVAIAWAAAVWEVVPRDEARVLTATVFLLPVLVAWSTAAARRPLLSTAVWAGLGGALAGAAAVHSWPAPVLSHVHVVTTRVSSDVLVDFSKPDVAAEAVSGAALGGLLAVAGVLCRRALSLTAVPADHPVFTEGPYVRAARDAAARAEVASPS